MCEHKEVLPCCPEGWTDQSYSVFFCLIRCIVYIHRPKSSKQKKDRKRCKVVTTFEVNVDDVFYLWFLTLSVHNMCVDIQPGTCRLSCIQGKYENF